MIKGATKNMCGYLRDIGVGFFGAIAHEMDVTEMCSTPRVVALATTIWLKPRCCLDLTDSDENVACKQKSWRIPRLRTLCCNTANTSANHIQTQMQEKLASKRSMIWASKTANPKR